MDLDDVIEILHHSSNLVDCSFGFNYQKRGTAHPLVHLPHLAKLAIETQMSPANLFDWLVVPRLRNLDVLLDYCGDDNDMGTVWWDWLEPLLLLIFRSSCSIQSFSFKTRDINFNADDLTRCLQAMPALQDLTLDLNREGNDAIENILCCLTHRSAEPCILPKLVYFDLNLWWVSSKCKLLLDMIQSRWRMVHFDGVGVLDKPTVDVACLQVVILRGMDSSRDSSLLACLRKFKDEGMRIDLWD